jgi:arginase
VAAVRDHIDPAPALLYIDRHLDCNTPDSTADGALDWMGMAHGFDLPGTVDAVCEALGHRPLLEPNRVAFLGVDLEVTTEWERRQVQERSLFVVTAEQLSRRPAEAASDALDRLPAAPLIVHVDVDVLDFIDAPLAENTDSRNVGPSLRDLRVALEEVKRRGGARVMSIGELNPTRSAGAPDAIPNFVAALAAALAAD